MIRKNYPLFTTHPTNADACSFACVGGEKPERVQKNVWKMLHIWIF